MRTAGFQASQSLNKKTQSLQLIARREQGAPHTTEYYWERTNHPNLQDWDVLGSVQEEIEGSNKLMEHKNLNTINRYSLENTEP